MNIEITLRSDSLSPALRAYAEEQMATLERFGEEFEGGELVFDQVSATVHCEAILRRKRGEPFIAKDSADDARVALDNVVDKLKAQYVKFKEKHSAKARRHKANEDR